MTQENFNTLEQISQNINKIGIGNMMPNLTQPEVSEEQVCMVINGLAKTKDLSTENATAAICGIFIRGGANRSSKLNQYVEVYDIDKNLIKVFKKDLLDVVQNKLNNKNLRRLAKAMAKTICSFAESYGLQGDLAKQLNALAYNERQSPLTKKEEAWACSFCQDMDDLETLATPRLKDLLFKDYNLKFNKETKLSTTEVVEEPKEGKKKTTVKDKKKKQ